MPALDPAAAPHPAPPRQLIITDLGRTFTVEATGDDAAATIRSLSALVGRVYDWAAEPRTPEATP